MGNSYETSVSTVTVITRQIWIWRGREITLDGNSNITKTNGVRSTDHHYMYDGLIRVTGMAPARAQTMRHTLGPAAAKSLIYILRLCQLQGRSLSKLNLTPFLHLRQYWDPRFPVMPNQLIRVQKRSSLRYKVNPSRDYALAKPNNTVTGVGLRVGADGERGC